MKNGEMERYICLILEILNSIYKNLVSKLHKVERILFHIVHNFCFYEYKSMMYTYLSDKTLAEPTFEHFTE